MARKIVDPKVKAVFNGFPPPIRKKLMGLRKIIFDVANDTEGVSELSETLKWGQPSYLTEQSKSGSTVRIGREKKGLILLKSPGKRYPVFSKESIAD